jgi:hypothetical protein
MRSLLIAVASVLLLSACVSARYMRYTEETFPPTTEVEVLRTKPADRAYLELGEISLRLNKSTADNAILILKEKAREIGADAIVILGERYRGSVAAPVGYMAVAVPVHDLVAVAIRYKR